MKSRDQGLGIRGWSPVICVAAMATAVTQARSLIANEGESDLRITVRVYNYAAVSLGTLRRAEEEATRILRAVGIEMVWLNCPMSKGSAKDQACKSASIKMGVDLRILEPAMAARFEPGRDDLGFALQSPRADRSSDAWVFYQHVEELAAYEVADRGQILGHAIAHEIGHLLLGSDRHSDRGIMRAHWDRKYLQEAARGQLWFSPDQAKLIRTAAASRRSAADRPSHPAPRARAFAEPP